MYASSDGGPPPGSAHTRPSAHPPSPLAEIGGQGGDPLIFVPLTQNLFFFFLVKTPCKISEPYDNPLWEKSNLAERKKEKQK
jgi:hypothetical protein